jgi:hypothetical protein
MKVLFQPIRFSDRDMHEERTQARYHVCRGDAYGGGIGIQNFGISTLVAATKTVANALVTSQTKITLNRSR